MGKKKQKKQKSARHQRMQSLQILGIFGVLTAVVFMPTTIVLFFAMLPTIVAGAADHKGTGTRTITIGAMNAAGTTPYLLDLWTSGHTPNNAMSIIFDPNTIIVCYAAAAFGYFINWGTSVLVKGFLIKNAQDRVLAIRKRQEDLVARWGIEVSGTVALDASGFPVDEDKNAVKAEDRK